MQTTPDSSIPYSSDNPVIYDNDAHADVYTDELLLALSSAGRIDLRGFITTTPANDCVNADTYEIDFAGREAIIRKAERSGFRRTPAHYAGPAQALVRPESAEIDDTPPIDTAGSRLIVDEARKASGNRPLVLCMGGPLTVAADAYLLDRSIADRIIVSWLGGRTDDMRDYNGGVDRWACCIVASRLRLVQFPAGDAAPLVPRSRLRQLPPTELTRWMIDKRLPHVMKHEEVPTDGDGQPVIPLIRPDYVYETKQVSVDRLGDDGIPEFRDDPAGPVTVVTNASEEIATEAWWSAVSNPEAWHHLRDDERRPYYAAPFPIGRIARIEAEDFDRGGRGIAYGTERAHLLTCYRRTHVRIEPAGDTPGGYNVGAGDGYCVTGFAAGDWLGYTIDVTTSGVYEIAVRAASDRAGTSVHLEIDGEPVTAQVELPDTGGARVWQTVRCGERHLEAGVRDLRLVVDSTGGDGESAAVNYIELSFTRSNSGRASAKGGPNDEQ